MVINSVILISCLICFGCPQLLCEDNLVFIKSLERNSVDLIYFDPPFAITEAGYDKALDWASLWPEMWRVLKPNGSIVIHSSQPFTYDLVAGQRKFFKYAWYWNKHSKTGHLFSKHQPLRMIEEVCVFYKRAHKYFPQTTQNENPKTVSNSPGNYYSRTSPGKKYTNDTHYPNHLLEFKRRNHKYSTRPDELCEYMISTFTEVGDLVLDLTCSDAQTGRACTKLKRAYIGVDIDPEMIKDAIQNNE